MPEKSPQAETLSDAFYFIGFVLFIAVICCAAGLAWGLLMHFYPSKACMILQTFSFACK
jgi:hypothetical protein